MAPGFWGGLLLLSAASALLTIAMLEAGSQVWLAFIASPPQYIDNSSFSATLARGYRFIYGAHPYLGHALEPNYQKGLTHHNSRGFRGHEIAVPKPKGVFRIAVLGGSTVYDTAIADDSRTFAARLEQLLRAGGCPTAEVVNAGVGWYGSWEMLAQFAFRVLDIQPDLVIVNEATNDVSARLVPPQAYRSDNTGFKRPWREPALPWWEHFALGRILGRRLGLSRQVVLDGFIFPEGGLDAAYLTQSDPALVAALRLNPPVFYRRNIESLLGVAQVHGVKVLLTSWAHSPRMRDFAGTAQYELGFGEHNAIMRRLAAKHSLPFFDLAASMPQDPQYWSDGRHVNEAGALLKARLFQRYLVSHGLVPRRP